MESQRSFLIIGLALVSFLLWQQWQIDYGPKPIQPVSTESTTEQPINAVPSAIPSAVQSTAPAGTDA